MTPHQRDNLLAAYGELLARVTRLEAERDKLRVAFARLDVADAAYGAEYDRRGRAESSSAYPGLELMRLERAWADERCAVLAAARALVAEIPAADPAEPATPPDEPDEELAPDGTYCDDCGAPVDEEHEPPCPRNFPKETPDA